MKQNRICFMLIILFISTSIFGNSNDIDYGDVLGFTNYSTEIDFGELETPGAKAHKILGYVTNAVSLSSILLTPEIVGEDVHNALGYTAAGLSAASISIGVASHIGDLDFSNGLTSGSVHGMFGSAGGTMMVISAFIAPAETHELFGTLGVISLSIGTMINIIF